MISVTFVTNGGKVAAAEPNTNLLRISLREKGGIPFKCGGGLCGTCRCHIDSGIENTDAVKAKMVAGTWTGKPLLRASYRSAGMPSSQITRLAASSRAW